MLHRLGPVVEAETDAPLEHVRDDLALAGLDALVNDVSAEWQRQPVVLAAPPHAEVFAADEPFILEGQLPLVDDQPHIGLALVHGFENFVERHDGVVELLALFAEPKLQREERARHCARHGDPQRGDRLFRERLARHQHWAIAVAHARAAGQQGVLVAHMRVGMDADRRDVQLAAAGPLVQRLDVLQDVLKIVAAVIDQSLGQAVKHERIVRVG